MMVHAVRKNEKNNNNNKLVWHNPKHRVLPETDCWLLSVLYLARPYVFPTSYHSNLPKTRHNFRFIVMFNAVEYPWNARMQVITRSFNTSQTFFPSETHKTYILASL